MRFVGFFRKVSEIFLSDLPLGRSAIVKVRKIYFFS